MPPLCTVNGRLVRCAVTVTGWSSPRSMPARDSCAEVQTWAARSCRSGTLMSWPPIVSTVRCRSATVGIVGADHAGQAPDRLCGAAQVGADRGQVGLAPLGERPRLQIRRRIGACLAAEGALDAEPCGLDRCRCERAVLVQGAEHGRQVRQAGRTDVVDAAARPGRAGRRRVPVASGPVVSGDDPPWASTAPTDSRASRR